MRLHAGKAKKRALIYVDKKPFESFFAVLGLFLLLIVISSLLGTPKQEEKKQVAAAKQVTVYTVGSAPKLTVQAQVEKSGVVHISALTPGVIQTIRKQVGQKVKKGEVLFNLSTNYQGGNSASLSRQLSQTQYQNIVDTYDTQKDMIRKQRDIAEKTDAQADQLRSIADQALHDTNDLINLNNDILSQIDKNIAQLEQTNVNGSNDALILSTKELKSQFLSANNQAKQASRTAQLNSSEDQPPAQLSTIQKELTLQQLTIQDKMLDLNREVSRIQLQIARVTEAMMFPSAPFAGTVEKVFVKVGQQVNPGTELMVLSESTQDDPVIAIAYVSADIAHRISKLETSVIHVDSSTSFEAQPTYITQEAIQGSLYGVFFDIPEKYASRLTEKGFITIQLPIGYYNTSSVIPYVPIDAVYQTKEQDYVFVDDNGKAIAKTVELGNVFGSFVEVTNGLVSQDKVILDRNVIADDKVEAK